jgi:hypothetical protein
MNLWDIEAHTFSRQSANSGEVVSFTLLPVTPLPPGRFLVLMCVGGWVDPSAIVRLEEFFFLWRYSPNLGHGLPPWNSPFHFGFLDLRQSVALLGRVISSLQGLYLYTNTKYPCPEWDSNPRSRLQSERRQCIPLDRLEGLGQLKIQWHHRESNPRLCGL